MELLWPNRKKDCSVAVDMSPIQGTVVSTCTTPLAGHDTKGHYFDMEPRHDQTLICEILRDMLLHYQLDTLDAKPVKNDTRSMKAKVQRSATTTTLMTKEKLVLSGRRDDTYPCLDYELAEKIRNHLPSRIAQSAIHWTMFFSLDQHGSSINTLYHNAEKQVGPCLLVIQTSDVQVFGAYLSEQLCVCPRYYGSGECFLWKLGDHQQLQVFPWTSKNEYLIYSDRSIVALGGGNGQFGLCLHADLTHGHTQHCETFDNPPLVYSQKFECVALELWSMGI